VLGRGRHGLYGHTSGLPHAFSSTPARAPHLNRADLWGANLRWAVLSKCDLRGADLRGADLTNATLPSIYEFLRAQLILAFCVYDAQNARMPFVPRTALLAEIEAALRRSPIVALLGPRQSGKTTLARALASRRSAEIFDLEDPLAERRLESPRTTLTPLRGLVVLDEVQRKPDLFPLLRVLADRRPIRARFLLLGSAAPELVRGVSETLAGRVAFVSMGGFSLNEAGPSRLRALWERGGFPPSFLARSRADSVRWRQDFIQTFLERDVRNLGIDIPAPALRRLWTMAAHAHGGVLNASELGQSLGVAHTTARRHLDVLAGAFVLRLLPPWFENLKKRQVKSPKLYVRDTGLLHALLGIESHAELESHPKLGASWEGFVVEEVLRIVGERSASFWATPAGAELDLFVQYRGRRIGIEIKHADAPRSTRSMQIARADLKLDDLLVVYPGETAFRLPDGSRVVPLAGLTEAIGGARRRR
jgi:predicted AAA+ superfamily ATPase